MIPNSIYEVATEHRKWIESVGWAGKRTPLEALTLIASEVGEAANECRGDKPTAQLGEELADIILRVLDVTIDLEMHMISYSSPINETAQRFGEELWAALLAEAPAGAEYEPTNIEMIGLAIIPIGFAMEELRKNGTTIELKVWVITILKHSLAVPSIFGFDVAGCLRGKMAKNKLRGTRGRKK